MKLIKLERVKLGDELPIVRLTFKTFWGKKIVRDACKNRTVEDFWDFVDNGQLTHDFSRINTFYNSGAKEYVVNGS